MFEITCQSASQMSQPFGVILPDVEVLLEGFSEPDCILEGLPSASQISGAAGGPFPCPLCRRVVLRQIHFGNSFKFPLSSVNILEPVV